MASGCEQVKVGAPSARISALPRSGIREVMELALELPDAIRLEIGDPDFTTPSHIVDAAAAAAHAGFTHYSPGIGLPTLRELVARKVTERNGFACTPAQVVIATGAAGALYLTLLALLDPGDELLVPDPGWTTYVPMAQAAGVVPVPYSLDRSTGFGLDVEAIATRIGHRTRALVVNSPGNPTGAVATREELEQVAALADRHGLWLISDECYEDLVLDGEHLSVGSVADPARTVGIFSFSKSYAMTGWRVGYAVVADHLAPLVAKAQECVVSSASTISQKAAEAALTGPQDAVGTMREAYRRRRDRALEILDAAEVRYVRPAAAFYLLVDISASGAPADEFARRLLLDHHVAVVPGGAFGSGGTGLVRVSLAAPDDVLEQGISRLAQTLSV